MASAISLLWPLVAPVAAVYWAARRTPKTKPVTNDKLIAELEKELDVGR